MPINIRKTNKLPAKKVKQAHIPNEYLAKLEELKQLAEEKEKGLRSLTESQSKMIAVLEKEREQKKIQNEIENLKKQVIEIEKKEKPVQKKKLTKKLEKPKLVRQTRWKS